MFKSITFTSVLLIAAKAALIDPQNLPLSTKVNITVDKNGNEVRLACVSWGGAYLQ